MKRDLILKEDDVGDNDAMNVNESWGDICQLLAPGWPAMSPNVREPNVNGFSGIQTLHCMYGIAC